MMDEIKIEKGVPIPTGWSTRGSWGFLAAMEVGDSAFLPPTFLVKPRQFWGLTKHIRAKLTDRKFATRTVEGGTRVWRIK